MVTEEKLLGDLTADVLRIMRADRVANAISRITGRDGKPCTTCQQRKMALNEFHRQWRDAQAKNQAERNEALKK